MSNDVYQQRQFWKESCMDKIIKRMQKRHLEEEERLFYSADKGSTLDKIWNKNKKQADGKNN